MGTWLLTGMGWVRSVWVVVFGSILLSGCQLADGGRGISEEDVTESVRKVHQLGENWRFQIDVRDIGERERWFEGDFDHWGQITVPGAWNCIEEGLWQYQGIGWYATTIGPDD